MSIGALDIFLVVFHPKLSDLDEIFSALLSQEQHSFDGINIHIWDNSLKQDHKLGLAQLKEGFEGRFNSFNLIVSEENLGFGRANNRLSERSSSPWIFLLNQDAIPEPDMLAELSRQIENSDETVVAWECRQIPYEHPKVYNPSSLETEWNSGAAVVYRRKAYQEVGGFDENFFMYAEDVDLSWRLRACGYRLKYIPRAAVYHDTYSEAGEVKPIQAIEGTLNNLLMRVKYGSWADIRAGVLGVLNEARRPQSFPGRRLQMALLVPRMLKRMPKLRRANKAFRENFKPSFVHWDYSLHREGAFFEFRRRNASEFEALVSIVVRTHKRPEFLREALLSLVNQTYNNLEIIVIEDGEDTARELVEKEFSEANISYHATGKNVGRSEAGNIGLAMANGEWLGFLDDDDQFFCDHVEVMVQSAQENQTKGIYGTAWEVATDVESVTPLAYTEFDSRTVYKQEFCRPLMWHRNYLPIQCVLFHREIYKRWGGFETDMDQLEDWNLWTRYTFEHDFKLVDKTTSKYRVPYCEKVSADRQEKLDAAYQQALEKQKQLELKIGIADFFELYHSMPKEQVAERLPFSIKLKHALKQNVKRFI
ncbi:glycosyltransferase family 2 protein [uncultured Pseudoteredinibacter sp.]|uniref:glycosyltransferase family 2 protein n=1 Tax=uncultured Pseudoteredinibacter sp. TaxID=1641701 RepID=UPI002606BF05|nr:glycosyltransferase family 2 protein [uncultured Pseudoteredinibacter sp.]